MMTLQLRLLQHGSCLLKHQYTRQVLTKATNFPSFLRNQALLTPRVQSFCSKSNDEGELIYGGNLTRNLKYVKYFSLATSAFGLSLQPYVVYCLYDKSSVLMYVTCGILTFMTFLTPILIHSLSTRYITEVHFNKQSNVFTIHTLSFFNRITRVSFMAQDVKIPDISGAFSNIKIKGRPYFLVPEDFENIEAYEHMVGFDKPIDFSLKSDEEEKT